MNKKDKNASFFSSLLSCFKRLMVSSPPDSSKKPTNKTANSLSPSQIRYLERCLKKDCEMELSRKKLEHCWQETLKYE